METTIGNGEIIVEDVLNSDEVHQCSAWSMALLGTNPRTTRILIEGIFRDAARQMMRVDKSDGIYFTWKGGSRELATEGWPDRKIRVLSWFRGVPCTLYISKREDNEQPVTNDLSDSQRPTSSDANKQDDAAQPIFSLSEV